MALYVQTRFECMQIFFRVLHFFYKAHAARYLHWSCKLDDRKLTFKPYAFIALPAGASEFFFCLPDYNPERVCCFHLRDFNRPPKRKQTLTAKKMFFPYKNPLTYKNFNLRTVMLSLSAEIIRKCMSIDISFSFTTWNVFTCTRPCSSNGVFIVG